MFSKLRFSKFKKICNQVNFVVLQLKQDIIEF